MLNYARQPHAHSYYAATATPWTLRPALDGNAQYDVCVIGGGLAGLSTALNLAERGFSVGLLEGSQIGFAASGRNGGQVISGFACDMDTLRAQAGEEYARSFWDMSVEAVEIIDQRVRQHQIDCDWTRGYCTVAVKPRQLRDLAAWQQEAAGRYGYQHYQWWDLPQLRSQLGSERYVGGLFDPLAGHLHPLNYTLGLARAAEAAGVTIYENTPVRSLVREPSPQAVTERGSVSCKILVLACNVFGGTLAPELSARIMPVGTYVIATEPLGAERARGLIANNMAVCDSNFVLDYYRLSADHRMLFGGKVSYSGREPRDLAQAMRSDMLRVFPQLADVSIDYAWGGFCDITMNRAPDFGRLSPSIYYLQGFSGHGVNITGIAGKMLAEAIAHENTRFELFSRLRHRPFPGGALLRTPALVLGMLYYRLKDYL
ncbi:MULTISPECIES: FAD-binding oxidoreductase [unclassified Paludibacterium]|uniref:NAD(P)/FAD-dependent oxidoreductase n=1 Tax=unclassified Paludibacterium TaxID=2618429 RepID=UPI001C042A61|nr:FAD-binding oxidoreductase [Paludibacterium sp. B53371]BEV71498.1 FAD-binding oxidoreductase [Paludibacterium sp. THUN1379]